MYVYVAAGLDTLSDPQSRDVAGGAPPTESPNPNMNATSPNAHPPSILPPSDDADRRQSNVTLPDAGYRRRVATVLLKVNKLFETPASSSFDDSQFTHGPAVEFPELPGEEN